MSGYGLILIISIIFPIIFSFHPKICFYKDWVKVLVSGLIVSVPFWVWDAIAVRRGDWAFNNKYVGFYRIVSLPLEEILFFLVIPFCCLFIWQILNKKLKDVYFETKVGGSIFGIIIMGVLAFIWRDRYYTFTLLLWGIITIILTKRLDKKLFVSVNYWKWILITYLPFLLVNGLLTGLPIVEYSDLATIGVKIGTIPIEDFLYSWSLLTLNLVVYKRLGSNVWELRKYYSNIR